MLVDWLTDDGMQVSAAAGGEDGLRQAAGTDVVVLDYNLPDIDGFEVLRRLSARDPSLPVIMMTGHASVEHAVEAMKRGAFHYVPKPIELAAVSNLVRGALRVSEARERMAPPAGG